MDRKTVLALTLCIAVVWFWTRFVMVPPAEDAGANKSSAAQKDGKAADAKATVAEKKAEPAQAAAAPVETPAAVTPATRQAESFTTVEIPGRARATLSSWGAALHDLVLLDPQHKERSGDRDIPIDLVSTKDAPLPFAITFPDSGFELAPDADYLVEPGEGNERRYSRTAGSVKIEKHWRFVPGSYQGELTVTLSNTGDKPIPAQLRMSIAGRQEPGVEPSLLRPSVIQTEGVCSAGKIKREALSSLVKEPVEIAGPVRFIAIDRKYFVLAAAVAPDEHARCRIEATASGRITTTLTLPPRPVAPGGKQSWTFTTFMGPKIVRELDDAKVTGSSGAAMDAHLGDLMNYGFTEIFARPMLWVLKAVHRALGNWGIAIILLTVLIKLVTWWPTAQSMKSAASMAKLKPEMDKLKEKYGDDKARMNQEVMALYQKHKINPLGGCLPVLIQMPIYIALYSMLGNSVELYRAAFGLWIHDLTGPDPYFVLPLLTGVLMFIQQKLSPAAVDPSQKTMMTMMPLMFTGMSIFLPAGLTLYILTNTALSMVQQRISTPKTAAGAEPAAPNKSDKKKKADK